MAEYEIKVTVSKFADRPCFIMRYTDPVTGKRHSRSTNATTRREAERTAAKWEAELQEGRYQAPRNITWKEFRERYESEKLASLAKGTENSAATAMNHLERLIDPKNLLVLNSTVLSKFQAKMRQEGRRSCGSRRGRRRVTWRRRGTVPESPVSAPGPGTGGSFAVARRRRRVLSRSAALRSAGWLHPAWTAPRCCH